MTEAAVEYVGKDLESMDLAVNYHRWIMDILRPYLGKDIAEVGAGTGGVSEMLLNERPRSLTLIEPSGMFDELSRRMSEVNGETEILLKNDLFRNVAPELKGKVDTIVYINVLEHIEDDEAELKAVFDTLEPGGRVCIFVPANRFLFSEFDRSIGHFRRYGSGELKTKCEGAGLKIKLSRFFDVPGVLPWWIKYRLLGSTSMESGLVSLYDKLVVPVTKFVEGVIPPPVGKNLIVVAER